MVWASANIPFECVCFGLPRKRHSHDDVGWLKTADQYYWGDKNSIQNAGVHYIIDSVLSEIARQPHRRFVIVEMGFLWRWWKHQDEASKNLFRSMLEKGQLELICGGWSMADEASVDYLSLIDQHTTGFEFINAEIDERYRPLIGWQIDPFGHSREVAALFAEMGMNGLFFSRLDYQDRKKREQERTTELVWQLRPSTPELKMSLFTHILPRGNYMYPPGFSWETLSRDAPIMDDPEMDEYNAPQRVKQFEGIMDRQREQFPSNHMIVTMGMDFSYVNAQMWFTNMDRLIRATNNISSTYHMLYSSPSCYTRAVYQSVKALTNKTDDFFPYADKAQAYWTGYFTSRPSLKKIVRDLTNVLTTTRQLLAFTDTHIEGNLEKKIFYMKDAQGILQHHDAVTGTAKQAVTNDYRKRGAQAIAFGNAISANVLLEHLCSKGNCDDQKLEFCPLLNQTTCRFTEERNDFQIVVYNPLAEVTTSWLRLPVIVDKDGWQVIDPQGEAVPADLVPILADIKWTWKEMSKATHELVFKVRLPPLGSAVYFVQQAKEPSNYAATVAKSTPWTNFEKEEDAVEVEETDRVTLKGKVVSNGLLKVTLDEQGVITSLKNTKENVEVEFTHYLAFYTAQSMPGPPSGAYLFNPDSETPHLFTKQPNVTVVSGGDQVVELHYTYSSWAMSIIRMYAGEPQLEIQWVAGPIPVEKEQLKRTTTTTENPNLSNRQRYAQGARYGSTIGREVVSTYEASIENKDLFYTDANGREMLERQKDFRPTWKLQGTEPISQNYYPLNARISTKDEKAQMTVIVDRAQGGTGMRNGQLEVMVHRRLVQDDQLGVGEKLDEVEAGKPLIATGRQWVLLNMPKNAAAAYRKFGQRIMFPPLVAFGKDGLRKDWTDNKRPTMTSVGQSFVGTLDSKAENLLPANIHLLTLERDFQECSLLVRLEHLFEGGEDDQLAVPVELNLENFVATLASVESSTVFITEMALGANMPISDLVRLQWDTTKQGPGKLDPRKKEAETSKPLRYDELGKRISETLVDGSWKSITMLPLQIRTFCVRLE